MIAPRLSRSMLLMSAHLPDQCHEALAVHAGVGIVLNLTTRLAAHLLPKLGGPDERVERRDQLRDVARIDEKTRAPVLDELRYRIQPRADRGQSCSGGLLIDETERLVPRRHHEEVRGAPHVDPGRAVAADTAPLSDGGRQRARKRPSCHERQVRACRKSAASPCLEQVVSALAWKVATDEEALRTRR